MDPLAAPLSCPCVQGYAQRKYEVLAKHLEESANVKVKLIFCEALSVGLKREAGGRADVIIGKDSVVRSDAKAAQLNVRRVAQLTDKLGSTTQHGLMVVAKDDPAQKVSDLEGYHIIFGPSECDEKHQAALDLLKASGVKIPKKLAIDQACSEGATKVLKRGPQGKAAAVISSYAAPLLEGCGTIKKGDLRVVGKTQSVPFVSAFISESLEPAQQAKLKTALLSAGTKPELCTALETLVGFLPANEAAAPKKKK